MLNVLRRGNKREPFYVWDLLIAGFNRPIIHYQSPKFTSKRWRRRQRGRRQPAPMLTKPWNMLEAFVEGAFNE